MIIVASKEDQRVKFNITRRDNENGEVEAQLWYEDSKEISKTIEEDILEVIVLEKI